VDGARFDSVVKALAAAASRRSVLGAAAGLVGQALLGRAAAAAPKCAKKEEACDDDAPCCANLDCINGVCAKPTHEANCPPGQAKCRGTCVDVAADVANCGACGVNCAFAHAGAACVEGTCTLGACDPGWANCNADSADGCETDLGTDPANCGGCGQTCRAPKNSSATCIEGRCGIVCDPGYTQCGEICVDLLNNALHCGACETPCPDGKVCREAGCRCDEGGCPPDFVQDPETCACVCREGLTRCGEGCVDLLTDPDHCGGCGAICASGECINGACSCAGPTFGCAAPDECCSGTCCEGVCCGAGEACGKGRCNPAACPECQEPQVCGVLYHDKTSGCCLRDGDFLPGGCTPENAAAHCCAAYDSTGIGVKCAVIGGEPICWSRPGCPNDLTQCDTSCVDLNVDANNCGACGIACESGQCVDGTCGGCVGVGGACGGKAPAPECCSGRCCGGACCGDGELCLDGTCVTDCPAGYEICGTNCIIDQICCNERACPPGEFICGEPIGAQNCCVPLGGVTPDPGDGACDFCCIIGTNETGFSHGCERRDDLTCCGTDGAPCVDDLECCQNVGNGGPRTCVGGVCQSAPNACTGVDCDDGNPCTDDACDPVDGCQHPPFPDGTFCHEDGNNGECRNGECCYFAGATCTDGGQCCGGTCNETGHCCAATGIACSGPGDCCGGGCVNGACCEAAGDICAAGDECCGGTCLDGLCCAGIGAPCESVSDCCTPGFNVCANGVCVPDPLFGDGADGDFAGGDPNGVRTALGGTAAVGQPTIPVASTAGFGVGDEVLVIQVQGAGAGTHEFGFVAATAPGSLALEHNLGATYSQDAVSRAQVLRVPHFASVTGLVTTGEWDGGTGGIVAFRALDIVGATVDVSGKGFKGGYGNDSAIHTGGICDVDSGQGQAQQGTSYPGVGGCSGAGNGGGGGGGGHPFDVPDGDFGSGGGGGYGSPGGDGLGDGPGHAGAGGGVHGTADLSTIFLGSGGGGGTWGTNPYGGGRSSIQGTDVSGQGGGAAYVAARTIGGLSVFANGNAGGNSNGTFGGYAGGGGADGAIKIVGGTVELGAQAVGGAGGDGTIADGGSGGVGRIRVEYCFGFSLATDPPASTQSIGC
jgi:hypothetical protein